jgi:geranylgeranyl diphosphate synthase, type I
MQYNVIKNKLIKKHELLTRALCKNIPLGTHPFIRDCIKRSIIQRGKMLRSSLFILNYHAFLNKEPKGLYETALSLDLFHTFALIHDDIIDCSVLRRNQPSLYSFADSYIASKNISMTRGSDIAMIVGDIIYAFAMRAFFSVEKPEKIKQNAFAVLTDSLVYTGIGECEELLDHNKLKNLSKKNILRVYALKTAYYSFVAPLCLSGIFAGESQFTIKKLEKIGLLLGEAFQIQDDYLDFASKEQVIGKTKGNDLERKKPTLILWYMYNQKKSINQSQIVFLLSKKNFTPKDHDTLKSLVDMNELRAYVEGEIRKRILQAKKMYQTIPNIKKPQMKLCMDYITSLFSM